MNSTTASSLSLGAPTPVARPRRTRSDLRPAGARTLIWLRSAGAAFLIFSFCHAQIPTPMSVIGFRPGTAGRLADYGTITRYFDALAQASDRVQLKTLGQTTEGRPFVIAIITSPTNHARLQEIQRDNARLTDPRTLDQKDARAIIARNPTIIVVNESIHSIEVGPAQAGMVTAYHLASTQDPAWTKVLDDTVVLLTPCHNPDGYDLVVSWWNEHKDNPLQRGAPLPALYHPYAGHDNNRDWFMLALVESRLTVEQVSMTWFPQLVIDQHQMGPNGARLFVPPYLPPYEPNVHPLIRSQATDVGRHVLDALTTQGLKGVVCGRYYDAWSPSRAFMHYHGAARFLTEVASARLADPVERVLPSPDLRTADDDNPSPWRGGRWTLADIVRYSSDAALEAIRYGAKNREAWLQNFYTIHRDSVFSTNGPAGFVIPLNQPRRAAVARLFELLHLAGLEIERIQAAPFTRDAEAKDGEALLVRAGQPFFSHARALLLNTPYPVARDEKTGREMTPYDVTSHYLPGLFNVEVTVVEHQSALPPHQPLLRDLPPPPRRASLTNDHHALLDPRDERAAADALRALSLGHPVRRMTQPVKGLPAGALAIGPHLGQPFPTTAASVRSIQEVEPGVALKRIRLGVYESYTATEDEGWTRFVLDHFAIPYRHLRNDDLRRKNGLSEIDCLVLCDLTPEEIDQGMRDRRLPKRFSGGIGTAGAENLLRFVKGGGTLVTLNGSSEYARRLFRLPWIEIRAGKRQIFPRTEAPELVVPGALLATDVDTESALGYGLPAALPVLFWNSRGFASTGDSGLGDVQFPVRFSRSDRALSGHARGIELLGGAGAVAVAPQEEGRVVAFGFSPQFRAQTLGTFPLFLNALLLAGSP